MKCPTCQNELVPDSSNPGKVLCYTCKKRYDESEVQGYWASQAMAAQQPFEQPAAFQQPYGQPEPVQQPYGQEPPAQAGYDPYGAGATQQMSAAAQPSQPYTTAAGYSAPQQYGTVSQQMPSTQPPYGYQPKPGKGLAVASLVLGILALPLSWVPIIGLFCAVMGIAAIILGIIGIKKVSAGTGSGKGMAIAGLALGALALLLSVAMTALTGPVMFKIMGDPEFMEMAREVANGNITQEEFNQRTSDYANDLVNNTNTAKKPGTGTSNTTTTPSNATTPSNTANGAANLANSTDDLRPDQIDVAIEGAEVRNDAFGEPALIITYKVTNKSDRNISFDEDVFDNVSQPGSDRLAYAVVEEGNGYIDDDTADYIAPGQSQIVHACYELVQTGGTAKVRLEVMSDQYTDAILEQTVTLP